ncbi:transcription antitermination factor NusB [Fusibacter paucivorans]|uniref:Transcription antitermination protein NusB n=1 Tax=Fusibacter paucivorans TaxID=76009 RepID=A0ABS5PNF4_9FIRM|nr:transcription antitermination factor NusB [Fusibacter paucivorans]MBS7526705.1 transcription antitermination factor NusB [Fusibacter paucivorans]
MNRVRSREIAMEILYQMDIHKCISASEVSRFLDYYEEASDETYIRELVELFVINQPLIDERIMGYLKGWKLERIGRIDLAIIRVAITEILWIPSIPAKVSINEAINMGKKFVDDKSGKFINGILSHFIDEERQVENDASDKHEVVK